VVARDYNFERYSTNSPVISDTGKHPPQSAEILRLLRHSSFESRRQAIALIGKYKLSGFLNEVCESISMPELQADAFKTLSGFGREAEKDLIRVYTISGGNLKTCKILLRLIQLTGSEESVKFLLTRIWSGPRILKEIAAQGLVDCGYKASGEETDRLHQVISEIIEIMTWNISARICLVKAGERLILESLDNDIRRWENYLFNILSVTYDKQSITRIRENLHSETVQGINLALEMMDLVIDESIKPKLIAALDMVSDEEKIKNLYQFFPVDIPQYSNLTEDIINRDYNLVGVWTKASTLNSILKMEGENMRESVVALLFSSERILQEEALRLLGRTDKKLYDSVSERLPKETRETLDQIFNKEKSEYDLLFAKVQFLAGIFKNIQHDDLLGLAQDLQYTNGLVSSHNLSGHVEWSFDSSEPVAKIRSNEYTTPELLNENTHLLILPFEALDKFNSNFPDEAKEISGYMNLLEGKNAVYK
jgi:hypothetical protein